MRDYLKTLEWGQVCGFCWLRGTWEEVRRSIEKEEEK